MNRPKNEQSVWTKYDVVYLINYYLDNFSSKTASIPTKEPTEFMRKLDERCNIKVKKKERSIYMAFGNYHYLNPAYKKGKGLFRVTILTRKVWGKFQSDRKQYKQYAQQIEKAVNNNTALPEIDID